MNFYENIKYLVENKKRITLTEMVKILNLSTSMPSKWKDGTIPNGETLIKLADFLDESVDRLLGRQTKKEPTVIPNDGLNPKVQKVIRLIETKDIPDDVVDFILKGLEKYKK